MGQLKCSIGLDSTNFKTNLVNFKACFDCFRKNILNYKKITKMYKWPVKIFEYLTLFTKLIVSKAGSCQDFYIVLLSNKI